MEKNYPFRLKHGIDRCCKSLKEAALDEAELQMFLPVAGASCLLLLPYRALTQSTQATAIAPEIKSNSCSPC
jgi:hypothetical protein